MTVPIARANRPHLPPKVFCEPLVELRLVDSSVRSAIKIELVADRLDICETRLVFCQRNGKRTRTQYSVGDRDEGAQWLNDKEPNQPADISSEFGLMVGSRKRYMK